MRISARRNLIVENAVHGVRVMRFVRPELWQYLDDAGASANSPLFREVELAVLADLPPDWTLVANLGLVDAIGAAFYRCLLHIRKCVHERGARLVLCGLTAWHREIFELFRGPEVFTIVTTEADTLRQCRGAAHGTQQVGRPMDDASESFECAAA